MVIDDPCVRSFKMDPSKGKDLSLSRNIVDNLSVRKGSLRVSSPRKIRLSRTFYWARRRRLKTVSHGIPGDIKDQGDLMDAGQ